MRVKLNLEEQRRKVKCNKVAAVIEKNQYNV